MTSVLGILSSTRASALPARGARCRLQGRGHGSPSAQTTNARGSLFGNRGGIATATPVVSVLERVSVLSGLLGNRLSFLGFPRQMISPSTKLCPSRPEREILFVVRGLQTLLLTRGYPPPFKRCNQRISL